MGKRGCWKEGGEGGGCGDVMYGAADCRCWRRRRRRGRSLRRTVDDGSFDRLLNGNPKCSSASISRLFKMRRMEPFNDLRGDVVLPKLGYHHSLTFNFVSCQNSIL